MNDNINDYILPNSVFIIVFIVGVVLGMRERIKMNRLNKTIEAEYWQAIAEQARQTTIKREQSFNGIFLYRWDRWA